MPWHPDSILRGSPLLSLHGETHQEWVGGAPAWLAAQGWPPHGDVCVEWSQSGRLLPGRTQCPREFRPHSTFIATELTLLCRIKNCRM